MESNTFQERVQRLKEVNEVIEKLDPAIRQGAFSLLTEYVTGHAHKNKAAPQESHTKPAEQEDPQSSNLYARFRDAKPSDNAVMIAADLYSQYGNQPFTLDEMRNIADSVGVTIPSSLDMTLKQAQRDGKLLFQHSGRSEYKPTVHGELYFKKTYQVSKGTKQRPL